MFGKIKEKSGIIAGVGVCVFLAVLAFSEGDQDVGCILIGFALIIILVYALKKIWRYLFGQIPLRHMLASRRRFGKSDFAKMLLADFESRNWADYKELGGVSVYEDRVVSKSKMYVYADYGLTKIDLIDCRLLAIYLGICLPRNYRYYVDSVKEGYSWDSPYFVYETPGGHLGVGGGGDYREDVIGYSVKISPPKSSPKKYNPNW